MDWETDGSDSFFFFNDTATTEIYTLSLHDALPIWGHRAGPSASARSSRPTRRRSPTAWGRAPAAGAAGRAGARRPGRPPPRPGARSVRDPVAIVAAGVVPPVGPGPDPLRASPPTPGGAVTRA